VLPSYSLIMDKPGSRQ